MTTTDPGIALIRLDPVGGIAGDMFAAALIDLQPDCARGLPEALERSGLGTSIAFEWNAFTDGVLRGRRFIVRELDTDEDHEHEHKHEHAHEHGHSHEHEHAHEHGHAHEHERLHRHGHRSFSDIRDLLGACDLSNPVRERALAIFEVLARAEGWVHGIVPDDVTFHEVGAWDSIGDIVAAAWLIETLSVSSWSCAALPVGRGLVSTQHGRLPVPAPATLRLLEGMPTIDDGVAGERITPTGAAILAHLEPSFGPRLVPMVPVAAGHGFGSKRFEGFSNVLRATGYAAFTSGAVRLGEISICEFEVDDQTPEDLAVGLARLRELDGVHDVSQSVNLGKKGRVAHSIRVLAAPDRLDDVLRHCFEETTTIGVRFHNSQRAELTRELVRRRDGDTVFEVKRARRPDDGTTEKVEMDQLADAGGHAARERLRRRIEQE